MRLDRTTIGEIFAQSQRIDFKRLENTNVGSIYGQVFSESPAGDLAQFLSLRPVSGSLRMVRQLMFFVQSAAEWVSAKRERSACYALAEVRGRSSREKMGFEGDF